MIDKVYSDLERFYKILREKARKDLRKRIGKREINFIYGRKGDIKGMSVPVDFIKLPRIKYDELKQGGIGQGKGEAGTDLGPVNIIPGKEAGDMPGMNIAEIEFSVEELFGFLMEELKLPRIKPKQAGNITSDYIKYDSIAHVGPETLRHPKKTYLKALKREIQSGTYDSANPIIIPIPKDKRYRAPKEFKKPENNAVIIHMMDVSASMTKEDRETVKTISNLAQILLEKQYNKLESAYIIHDARANIVDKNTFYTTHRTGGTIISSAHKKLIQLIEKKYKPEFWNIYSMYFSDGANFGDDNETCIKLLKDKILPRINQYSYCQVDINYEEFRSLGFPRISSGEYISSLEENFDMEKEPIVWTSIESGETSAESLFDVIKEFFESGR